MKFVLRWFERFLHFSCHLYALSNYRNTEAGRIRGETMVKSSTAASSPAAQSKKFGKMIDHEPNPTGFSGTFRWNKDTVSRARCWIATTRGIGCLLVRW